MKKTIAFLLLFIFTFSPLKTLAWGERGHTMVAEIAFKYLDRKTKKKVLKYLDQMSLSKTANWMDFVKNDHAYDSLKPLHYVDFEKGMPAKDTCCNNIIQALNNTINQLKNYQNLSNDQVKTQLCYLFHLMGDLHQPLHVGYPEDKGGNKYQIFFDGKGTNLHMLYDEKIIQNKNITLQDCLHSKEYSNDEIKQLQSGTIVDWANDSRSHLDQVYNTNGHKVSPEYIDANTILIENQIEIAGIRLASVLDKVFNTKK